MRSKTPTRHIGGGWFWVTAWGLVACAAGCGGTPSVSDGWKDSAAEIAAGITLGAEHGCVFYAFDAMAYPDAEAELTVRILHVRKLQHVEGVTVEYFLGKQSLGRATTDKDGYAKLKWKPPQAKAPQDHEITAKIVAVPDDDLEEMLKATPASLLVAVRPKDASFAVIDLDHTVVDSGFARVLIGGAKPMPQAAKTVKELAGKYDLIYLTHRPDLLTVTSKRWLTDNGFPRAPLLVSTFKQAIGDSGEYKSARLKQLREQYPRLEIGIGDKLSDAKAYADNGMKPYLIPHYDKDDDDDVRDMAEEVRKLKADVQVVEGWDDIRDGVFKKKSFPPAVYAKRLDDRSRALQMEKQRKKKDDD